jgi:hypothetical protein
MTEGMQTTAAPETAVETPQAVEAEISTELGDLRNDAAKAVEEALRAAEDGEAEEKPDVPAAKASERAAEKPVEPPKKGIGDILSAREKAAEPKTEAQKIIEEAKAARDEIAKARAELDADRATIAAEKAKIAKLKDIRNAPDALKELGWEPEEFIVSAAEANTPMGQLKALVKAQAEKLEALTGKADTWEKQAEEQTKTAKEQAEKAALKQVEEAFITKALDPKTYPALPILYEDEEERAELLTKAHNVARRYRVATGGEEASFEQIAEYLEDKAKQKLEKWLEAQKAGTPESGKAQPGGRPTGKRTLNGSDASVRTSAPTATVKVTDDLDDLGKRARQAAERAIRESSA